MQRQKGHWGAAVLSVCVCVCVMRTLQEQSGHLMQPFRLHVNAIHIAFVIFAMAFAFAVFLHNTSAWLRLGAGAILQCCIGSGYVCA